MKQYYGTLCIMATQYYGTFVGTIWKHKMKQYSAWKETNTRRPLQFSVIKNICYACKKSVCGRKFRTQMVE